MRRTQAERDWWRERGRERLGRPYRPVDVVLRPRRHIEALALVVVVAAAVVVVLYVGVR